MKKTLPSIRVDGKTILLMKTAIKKYNEKNLINLSLQEFRRISYELLSRIIIDEKEIPIKLN